MSGNFLLRASQVRLVQIGPVALCEALTRHFLPALVLGLPFFLVISTSAMAAQRRGADQGKPMPQRTEIATQARLRGPGAITLDSRGNLFIAETGAHRIRKVEAATGMVTTIVGADDEGLSEKNGLSTNDKGFLPAGIALDGQGNIFFSDRLNHRVRRVDTMTGLVSTVVGVGSFGYAGDGGPAAHAQLLDPGQVVFDAKGNLLIADGPRVRKVDAATGIITTIAGTWNSGFSGDGRPAMNASLGRFVGIGVDRRGNLFIADVENYRIRRVDAKTGIITTVAGTGIRGFSGDGGPATQAQLGWPWMVAVNVSGDIFIADTANHRIRKVDATTGIITTVVGNGTQGLAGDRGPGTKAQLSSLAGIGLDGTGNLFLADGLRVRRLDAATGIIATAVGEIEDSPWHDAESISDLHLSGPSGIAFDPKGVLLVADGPNVHAVDLQAGRVIRKAGISSPGYYGDGGHARQAHLYSPSGMALDAGGNLFVADGIRVRKVEPGPAVITTVAGTSKEGSAGDGGPATRAQLTWAASVAVDPAGNLVIADGRRVRKVDATTEIITTVVGTGTIGDAGDGGPATRAQLTWAASVAFDATGNLFIADGARIRKVDARTLIIAAVAGTGVSGDAGDGGPAVRAQLRWPASIAIDARGNLFIADGLRVRRVDAKTGIITTVAGTGISGLSGDGGPATQAELTWASALALDASGDLFIADGPRIRMVDAKIGTITTVLGDKHSEFQPSKGDGGPAAKARVLLPRQVAVDTEGNLLISEHERIRRVDAKTGIITTVAGTGIGGFSGDGGPATSARLNFPDGLGLDASGNLFIAEYNSHRVRRVDAKTGIITTVAGTGLPGFSGDGGPATGARLWEPNGVVVDAAGNLFISDGGNARIRKVEATTGIITTLAGGRKTSPEIGGTSTSTRLNSTHGIALDGKGNLFVAEHSPPRIQKVDGVTGAITTVAGGGEAFPGEGGPATSARVLHPTGIAVDTAGNLFISDWVNRVVRRVDAATGFITTVAGGGSAHPGDGGAATNARFGPPHGLAVDRNGNLFFADYWRHLIRRVDGVTGIITTLIGAESE